MLIRYATRTVEKHYTADSSFFIAWIPDICVLRAYYYHFKAFLILDMSLYCIKANTKISIKLHLHHIDIIWMAQNKWLLNIVLMASMLVFFLKGKWDRDEGIQKLMLISCHSVDLKIEGWKMTNEVLQIL